MHPGKKVFIFLAFLLVLGSVLYLKFFNKRPEITIMNEFYQPVRMQVFDETDVTYMILHDIIVSSAELLHC